MRNTFTLIQLPGSGHFFVSSQCGIYISGRGTFNAPSRDGEFISVPGRNGDVWFDRGKYNNVLITYPAFVAPVDGQYGNYSTMREALAAFHALVRTRKNYVYITDTYLEKDYGEIYRRGILVDDFVPEVGAELNTATFDITFNCEPFLLRYPQGFIRLYGNDSSARSWTLNNTHRVPQRPVYLVMRTINYDANTLSFTVVCDGVSNVVSVELPTGADSVYINTETLTCYGENGENYNSYVSFSTHNFPVLDGTTCRVTVDSNTNLRFSYYEAML